MATQIFSLINMTHHIQFFDQSAQKTKDIFMCHILIIPLITI